MHDHTADMSKFKNKEVLDKVRTDTISNEDFTEKETMQDFCDKLKKKMNKSHETAAQQECATPECDVEHEHTYDQKKQTKGSSKDQECVGPECAEDHEHSYDVYTSSQRSAGQQGSTMNKGSTSGETGWSTQQQGSSTKDTSRGSQSQSGTSRGNTSQQGSTMSQQDRTSAGQTQKMKQEDFITWDQDRNMQGQNRNLRDESRRDKATSDHNEMRTCHDWDTDKDVTENKSINDQNLLNDISEEMEGTHATKKNQGTQRTMSGQGSRSTMKDQSQQRTTGGQGNQSTMRSQQNQENTKEQDKSYFQDPSDMINNNLNYSAAGSDTINDAMFRKVESASNMKASEKKDDRSRMGSDVLLNTQTNAGIGSESINPGKTGGNKFNDMTMKQTKTSDFTRKENEDRSNRWGESNMAEKGRTGTTGNTDKWIDEKSSNRTSTMKDAKTKNDSSQRRDNRKSGSDTIEREGTKEDQSSLGL